MVEIREILAPKGSKCRPGNARTGMLGVTIHETGNTSNGSGALNHAKYLQGGGKNSAVSWHYAVDDKLITRSVPENEHAWHAGDGSNGRGNKQTIAIEICVNPDSNYEAAKKNAAELAADILKRHGFKSISGCLFQHADFMNKNCPRRIRDEGKWGEFVKMVEGYMGVKATPVPAPVPASSGTYKVGGTVTLNGYVYSDSFGNGQSNTKYNRTGKITIVADLSRKCPYHFEGLGWVTAASIGAAASAPAPAVPAKTPDFRVGGKVKIKASAVQYSRSIVGIPSAYKGKTYTIQQVGNDDVLIKELYSWVKKSDAEGV